jgi:endonuclease YncB( thermonuclease family)
VYGRIVPVILLATIILALATPSTHAGDNVGIHSDFPHARVVVTEVVDGDTVRISPPVYVAGQYRTVVRLADIDAPDVSTPEGQWAKGNLTNLLAQYGGVVHLDIDKSRGVDDDGRIIAVVYTRVSESTLLNVNKWLVDNGYANLTDYTDNDFDPSKWSLYINYDVSKERLPVVNRVVISTGNFAYSASWGVRVAVTPGGDYIGVAFADFGGDYTLHVRVLNRSGYVVNSYDYSPDKGSSYYANVYRGMLDIAANETGFLVVWTNFTRVVGDTTYNRTVLYSYVPLSGSPTQPQHIFAANNQYHPLATYFIHSNGTKWWVVGYGRQTSSIANYTLYLLDLTPNYTRRFTHVNLAGAAGADVNIGVDVMGRLIFDNTTNSFIVVARNKTLDHDMIAIHGVSNNTHGFSVSNYTIDGRPGDQGPNPDMTGSFSYYNVYPMHTALLGSGRYVLTAYNESRTALAYAVVDLSTRSVNRQTLIDFGTVTTFYPWIAGGGSRWLLAYSTRGYVNFTLVGTDGINTGLLSLSDRNSAYVRATYDSGSGLFPVVYAVRDLGTGNYNVFLSLVNETDGSIGSFIIPINTTGSVGKIPINIVVLPGGSPGTVVVFTVEGNDLVAYYISSNYPESQYPIPIPEFLVAIPVVLATVAGVLLLTRKKRS